LRAVVGYLLGMSPKAELALSPDILALQIAPKVAFASLFNFADGLHGLSEDSRCRPHRVLPRDGERADRGAHRRSRPHQSRTRLQGDADADFLEDRFPSFSPPMFAGCASARHWP
jgi:hypothetical protein